MDPPRSTRGFPVQQSLALGLGLLWPWGRAAAEVAPGQWCETAEPGPRVGVVVALG